MLRMRLPSHSRPLCTLRLSYVLEAPVWKATYRILLDEPSSVTHPEKAGESETQPLIQGWAVVDNTSDEDWVDVNSTALGRPPGTSR